MKKLLLVPALLYGIIAGLPVFAQTETQAEIEAYWMQMKVEQAKKQKLIETQHGQHLGAAISGNAASSALSDAGGMKTGINFFYGYRISPYWMLGAYAGIDYLTPTEISYYSNSSKSTETIKRPAISFPVFGEVRFYFGTSRVMPFIYTDFGASISKFFGVLFNAGVGLDINITGSHTFFLNAGIGSTPIPYVPDAMGLGTTYDQQLKSSQFTSLCLRLGYYF